MNLDGLLGKTPATLDELWVRVYYALDRHPLCRGVEFDIIRMPRTRKTNWTVNLHSVPRDALFEAHEIVSDIQDACELAAAA